MKKMSVDDKLALDLFHTDEEESHIKVDLDYRDEVENQEAAAGLSGGVL